MPQAGNEHLHLKLQGRKKERLIWSGSHEPSMHKLVDLRRAAGLTVRR
jgi:hypothetical protein